MFVFFAREAIDKNASLESHYRKKRETFRFHLLPRIVKKITCTYTIIAGRFSRQFIGGLRPDNFHGILLVSGESRQREDRENSPRNLRGDS